MSTNDGIITTNLVDLRGVPPTELTGYSAAELGPVLDRLRSQIQAPTVTLSGYNGAGTLVTPTRASSTTVEPSSTSTATSPPSAPTTAPEVDNTSG